MIKILLFPFISLIAFSLTDCRNSVNKPRINTKLKTEKISNDSNLSNEMGPPFKIECPCNVHSLGFYKINNDNFNFYLSGKGWDPDIYACNYILSEIKENINPPDTNITYVKIHLLDLDKFVLPNNSTEYGNDSIKKYVIAIFMHDIKKGTYSSKYDPYKTGKYHAPK
jgi:hypothetical protein